ncbi:right-handed parallel beta-helix repeat-containing protein [Anaerosporobacter sp.]|uniref:right-handed parallel beta-helix repeat-containing protein n=1 Tax=Anaerosporobacter sp. TaxID=1872529 RepID=UPI00286EB83A|nr:right-handed parallel beta-helix repeat-containing protein [Anaerosporobacter sp.]
MKQKLIALFSILLLSYLFLPTPCSLAASPTATLTIDGTLIGTYPSVQQAVDDVSNQAGSQFVIEIASGTVTDSLGIIQQPNKNLTICPQQGATVTFTNTITIDGDNHYYYPETLLIQGISFDFSSSLLQNCINLAELTTPFDHCYAHNITINNCHFTGMEGFTVGIQSVAGGMRNIAITNCTASNMHSLAQLKAVAGYALIQNCIVTNSESGVNFYGTANLLVDSCQFTITDYAVRSGQGSGTIISSGSVTINNSILENNSTTDGVIVLRGDSSPNINILHSILTASGTDGKTVQNLNATRISSYKISFLETDINGLISDIDTSTITTIDDPNIPNGPINLNPQPDYEWLLIFLIILFTVLIILVIIDIILTILRRRPHCPCCCPRCRRC